MKKFTDFVDENIFVYTSDMIDMVNNKLFGFILIDNILTNNAEDVSQFTADKIEHDASGAYILFKREGSDIKIFRDNMGLCQLFYYRDADFWAISNSLWKLTEKLKNKVLLTINEQVAESLIVSRMMHIGIGESLINEIKTVPIFAKVWINSNNQLVIENDYRLKNRIELDSSNAMQLIDEWISKWGRIYKGLQLGGWNMKVELSGGFDSRTTFSILKAAGVDFAAPNVQVQSSLPKEKVAREHFREDYEIASDIATNLGIDLYTEVNFDGVDIPEPEYDNMHRLIMEDGVNQFINPKKLYKETLIRVGGHLGETFRGYWNIKVPIEFSLKSIDNEVTIGATNCLLNSIDKAIEATGNKDIEAYINSEYLLMETLDVIFFGRQIQRANLSNIIMLSPFMDFSVRGIDVGEVKREVLYVIIMLRTCPELLNYPFDREQKFSKESIAFAKELCRKYPSQVSFDHIKPIKFYNFINDEFEFDPSQREDFLLAKRNKLIQYMAEHTYDRVFSETLAKALCRDALNKYDENRGFHAEDQMLALVTIGEYVHLINQKQSGQYNYSMDEFLSRISQWPKTEIFRESILNVCIVKCLYENENILRTEPVYIYGNGVWAKKIRTMILGIGIEIEGYVVTKIDSSKENVMSIDQYIENEKSGIIVPGVSAKYYQEIIDILRERGVRHIEARY